MKPTEAKAAKGWALFTSNGYIFTESVRRTRGAVVEYANNDAAHGWNWERYRRNGFFIAKVEIVPGRAALSNSETSAIEGKG